MGINIDIKLDLNKIASEILLLIICLISLAIGEYYNIKLLFQFSIIILLLLFLYSMWKIIFKILSYIKNL